MVSKIVSNTMSSCRIFDTGHQLFEKILTRSEYRNDAASDPIVDSDRSYLVQIRDDVRMLCQLEGGTEFVNELLSETLAVLAVSHSRSAAYSPHVMGIVEKSHQLLATSLRALEEYIQQYL